jgi:hypothetical protein
MSANAEVEKCPRCGEDSAVRQKLILIDERWVPMAGKDSRLAYLADLRVDDVETHNLLEAPLEQFLEGLYCERCDTGFISEDILREGHRRYGWRL